MLCLFITTFTFLALSSAAAPTVRYECDPCLERADYTIRVILHGSTADPFWDQVGASMAQSFSNMGVDWDMDLYDDFDDDQMAADIANVAAGKDRPDALLVSIPSQAVANAVQQVVAANIPVLGINTGSAVGKDIGVLDFVASDDRAGGVLAAEAMVAAATTAGVTLQTNILFVNDETGNQGMALRLAGFSEKLSESSVTVQEIEVDGSASPSTIQSTLTNAFRQANCPPVLLSGARTLQPAIDAFAAAGCSAPLLMGAFDTNQAVFDAIGGDQLAFTIGQQQALQGSLTALLAALYATTGKSLASSVEAEGGAYLTGPVLITKDTLPTDSQQVCENDAFPVCPNTLVRILLPNQCLIPTRSSSDTQISFSVFFFLRPQMTPSRNVLARSGPKSRLVESRTVSSPIPFGIPSTPPRSRPLSTWAWSCSTNRLNPKKTKPRSMPKWPTKF